MADIYRKEDPGTQDWDTASAWIGGVAPGAADTAIVNAGSTDITGMDFSATALAGVIFGSGYSGTVGSSGTKLQLNTEFLHFSSKCPAAWFDLSNGTSDIEVRCFDTVETIGVQASEGLHITASDALDPIRMHDGFCTIDSGAVKTVEADGGTLVIDSSVTSLTSIVQMMHRYGAHSGPRPRRSPVIDNKGANCPTVLAKAGKYIHRGTATIATVLEIEMGAIVECLSSGTITKLVGWGGLFDGRDSKVACTITTSKLWNGTIDVSNAGAGPFTFTNDTELIGEGARLITPAGEKRRVIGQHTALGPV